MSIGVVLAGLATGWAFVLGASVQRSVDRRAWYLQSHRPSLTRPREAWHSWRYWRRFCRLTRRNRRAIRAWREDRQS